MADSFLPAAGVIPEYKRDTESLTVGSNTVHRERTQVAGASALEVASVPAIAPTSAAYGLAVRDVPISAATFYAIRRDNIAASSVNIAFGFTASRVSLYTSPVNDDDIVVDWAGGTAVAPAANTAGDALLPPGFTLDMEHVSFASLSFLAGGVTGNAQSITVMAWK